MTATTSRNRAQILKLILVPGIISLAVTILRLIGELQGWSPQYFNRQAGGGGALVGISWLVIPFGAYFAMKLVRAGFAPASWPKAIGLSVVALGLMIASLFPPAIFQWGFYARLVYIWLVVSGIALLAYPVWPALFKTLLAYGLAARIPVVVVMFLAMWGNWGTHYDAIPRDFPPMGLLPKFIWIGLVPQLTVWLGFTIIVGSFFGSLAGALTQRVTGRKSAQVGVKA